MILPSSGPYSTGWRRLLHPIVVLPVVVVLAFGIWWVFLRSSGSTATRGASGATDQVVDVTYGPLAQTVSASGTIAAIATDALNFTSAGTVTAVNVRAGDNVIAGQVLATMESPALQAAVDVASVNLLQAQAKLDADTAAGASAVQLAVDSSQVAIATDALTAAESALKGAALKANFDGVVTSVDLVTGEVLGPNGTSTVAIAGSVSGSGASSSNGGTAASGQDRRPTPPASTGTPTVGQINVQSTGIYKLDVQVPSADIAKIAVDQSATVSVNGSAAVAPGGRLQATTTTVAGSTSAATGATATGKVTSVGAIASTSSGVATFPVTIVFTGDPSKFFVGASAVAAIATSSTGDVLSVPVAAISIAADGSRTVTQSLDGSATTTRIVAVTTGTVGGGRIEIRTGLRKGDQVVIPTTPLSSTTQRNGD